ncbi:MAG: hypothetical protein AAF567_17525 [Actinomycetota bacterium]
MQRRLTALSAERVGTLIEHAKTQGEDLTGEELEGLFEEAGETGPSPTLFMRIGKVPKSYVTGSPSDGLTTVALYADARSIENAEDVISHIETERPTVPQLLATKTVVRTSDGVTTTVGAIKANAAKMVEDRTANKVENDLVASMLLGGEEVDSGGYGSIEFRFANTKGRLVVDKAFAGGFEQIAGRNRGIRLDPQEKHVVDRWRSVYSKGKFPYPTERVGLHYVFIDDSDAAAFAVQLGHEMRSLFVHGPGATGTESTMTAARVPPGTPPQPESGTKHRDREYEYRSPRGSRRSGQKAAMGGWSASEYATQFNASAGTDRSWEWLHLQGSRLGGPNLDTNLVAGTAEANSQMIPYERAIYRLSSAATSAKPVKVAWDASLKKDSTSKPTHIGDKIRIEVSFPKGAPPATETTNPEKIAKLFPITFNALEGASVTKFDRDIIETRSGGLR